MSLVLQWSAKCIFAANVSDRANISAFCAMVLERLASLRITAVAIGLTFVLTNTNSSVTFGFGRTLLIAAALRNALAVGAHLSVQALPDAGTAVDK